MHLTHFTVLCSFAPSPTPLGLHYPTQKPKPRPQIKTDKQSTDSLPFFFVQFTHSLSHSSAKSPWFWLSSTAHQLHNPPPQSQPTALEHSRSNLSPSESTAAKSSFSFPVVSELVQARQDRRCCRKIKGDLESAQEVFDEMSERTVAKFG